MKAVISIFVLAVAFAGCAKSDVLDISRSKQIGFESSVSKTTKGAPVSEFAAGATMMVWGYTSVGQLSALTAVAGVPSDAVPVGGLVATTITKGSDGVWDYNPKGYWMPGSYHSFLAVAPATGSAVYNGGVVSFTNPEEVSRQVDFMVAEANYATAVYRDGNAAPVSIRFRHALTRIRLAAVVVETAGATDIRVSGVRMSSASGFVAGGRVNIAAQGSTPVEWTPIPSEVSEGYRVTPETPVAPGFDRDAKVYLEIAHAKGENLMVIPQTTGTVRFDVGISYKDKDGNSGETSQTFETSAAQVWTSNAVFAYKFRIDIAKALGMKVVVFAPTVTGWDDGGGDILAMP